MTGLSRKFLLTRTIWATPGYQDFREGTNFRPNRAIPAKQMPLAADDRPTARTAGVSAETRKRNCVAGGVIISW
jgi:hypothetical protein